jgi:hypothetical protein
MLTVTFWHTPPPRCPALILSAAGLLSSRLGFALRRSIAVFLSTYYV